MDKQRLITALKRQIKVGEEMMEVANQNYEAAARSVSEAKSALDELGGSKGQARKGKFQLSEKDRLSLKASITNITKNKEK